MKTKKPSLAQSNRLLLYKLQDIWSRWIENERISFADIIKNNSQLLIRLPGSNGLAVFVAEYPTAINFAVVDEIDEYYWPDDYSDHLFEWEEFPLCFLNIAIPAGAHLIEQFKIIKSTDASRPLDWNGWGDLFGIYLRYVLFALYRQDMTVDGWSLWFSYNKKRIKQMSDDRKLKEFEDYLKTISISKLLASAF